MAAVSCRELFHLPADSPLRVRQLTPDTAAHSNIYPETPVFLSDGNRFLITAGGRYHLCTLDGSSPPRPLFPDDGIHRTGVVVSPSGKAIYYFELQGEGLAVQSVLCRIDADTLRIERLIATPDKTDGCHPSHYYSIGTVSSDDKRYATSAFLGDGHTADAPTGLLVYNLENGEVTMPAYDRDFFNAHLQYCKSTEPGFNRDLLIQHNHGGQMAPDGRCTRHLEPPPEGLGVDLHVIRDDGTLWRDVPFGRDGRESCIGHQAWRGRGTSVISVMLQADDPSYGLEPHTRQAVLDGEPIATDRTAPHLGALIPGAVRRRLDEGFEDPRFCHFFCSEDTRHFAFDTFICEGEGDPKGREGMGQRIYCGYDDGSGKLRIKYLLNTYGLFLGEGSNHAHPILTPDNTGLLFNSTVTGQSQIYIIEGFVY